MEPWKFKVNDSREFDQLPVFLIFCEDEVSEPIYFKYFETPKIKVNILGGHKSKTEHVLNVIVHCLNENLMKMLNGAPTIQDPNTQVWCVFDRDEEPIPAQVNLGNTSYNESLETAKNRGIKVACSNDSFELWILLHLVEQDFHLFHSRNLCYEKLTEIFNTLENPNEDLVRAKQSQNFNYKKDLKSKNNFRNIVRAQILPQTMAAIERAKTLELRYNAAEVAPHQMRPHTTVHHLVSELLKLGGKTI